MLRWIVLAFLGACFGTCGDDDGCGCDDDPCPDGSHISVTVGPGGKAFLEFLDELFACYVGIDCDVCLPSGTQARLVIMPDEGHETDQIVGCPTGPFTPTTDLACNVIFKTLPPIPKHTLAVHVVGTGTVTGAEGAIDCPATACSAMLSALAHPHLDAAAGPGFTFAGWSGEGCTGEAAGIDVSLEEGDRECTATFVEMPKVTHRLEVGVQQGTMGVVRDEPQSLLDCGEDCSADVDEGTQVKLVAVPAIGWRFVSWAEGGDCAGTSPQATVTVDRDRACTAIFAEIPAQTFELTVGNQEGGSGTITSDPSGIVCPGVCSGSYEAGTAVTIQTEPSPGFEQVGWSGDAECNGAPPGPVRVVMDADKTCTAVYRGRWVLTVTREGMGTVTTPGGSAISCGLDCSARYSGGSVTLLATPDAGWAFGGWSGDCPTIPPNPAQVTIGMSTDRTCTAHFVPLYPLTIQKLGTGTGVVTDQPQRAIDCGTTCSAQLAGTVTLLATPDAGSTFAGWSGDCAGTAMTTTVTMAGARTCTATFDPAPKTCKAVIDVTQDGFFVMMRGNRSTGADRQYQWNFDWTEGIDVPFGPTSDVRFEDTRQLPARMNKVTLTIRAGGCSDEMTVTVPSGQN